MTSFESITFVVLCAILAPLIAIPVASVCTVVRLARGRTRPRIAAAVLLSLGVLCVLFHVALSLLGGKLNLYLYLFGQATYVWKLYLRLATVWLLAWGGLLLVIRRWRVWSTLLWSVLLMLSLLLFSAVSLFGHYDTVYTEISSPASVGEVHELVFEEKSWLLAGEGAVYEKVSPCFMRKLDDYRTDDGYCPVAADACRFEWRKDGFTMQYQFTAEVEYLPEKEP